MVMSASLQVSPACVTKWFKGAAWPAFLTQVRAGNADTLSGTPTVQQPAGMYHWMVAAGVC
jgi:hypothetical protein